MDQANAAVSEAQTKGQSADKIATAEKKRDAAQQRLDAATEKQTAAETRLSEVKDKAADGAEKGGGLDGKSLGQTFLSGIVESLGVPNFMNLLETPNFKSATALANYGLGLLAPQDGSDPSSGGGGPLGGAMSGLGLPNLANLLQPIGPQALTPNPPDAPHAGSGAPPGPAMVINQTNQNLDPTQIIQKINKGWNENWNRYMAAVRP